MSTTLTSVSITSVEELLAEPRVQTAFEFFQKNAVSITKEQIALTCIPAPPFGEQERSEYFSTKFQQLGLSEVSIDREGNCLGLRRGHSQDSLLVVSAHLDTVFPAGTDVSVREHQGKLFAPGIADDGCGLVALIALAEALNAGAIETERSILFVGTVGEEGQGNL